MRKVLVAVLCALAFSACEKIADYYNYPSSEPLPPCRLIQESDTGVDQAFIREIEYNAEGYPTSVTYTTVELSFPYQESYSFQLNYDDQKRLQSFTSDWVYGPDQVFFAYEGDSRLPVRDTLRGTYPNVFVEDFEYDANGRIVRVYKRIIEQWEEDTGNYPDEEYRFYYDIRGNRQSHPSNPDYNGLVRYSDNTSISSLHPVFQLLNHDFSRNATTNYIFNDQGLPVGVKDSKRTFVYECE